METKHVSYADALKRFRHMVHKYPFEYRALLIVGEGYRVPFAIERTVLFMDGSSLGHVSVSYDSNATWVETSRNGGVIGIRTYGHTEGLEAPMVMVAETALHQLTQDQLGCLRARVRGGDIDPSHTGFFIVSDPAF